jgi:hypothetical protein
MMKTLSLRLAVLAVALTASGSALADHNFGVGVKAGTLGIGVEGTWRPLPYIDFRAGANQYDYTDNGIYGGVNYDAEINLDNYYLTGNLRFPLSPFRLTGGLYSNGNEFNALSGDNGAIIFIGGDPYPADAVGRVSAKGSFDDTSPYLGVGFDFTVLGKVGMNLDFGVLWQGSPQVSIGTDGLLNGDPTFEASLEAERVELENELSDYKIWPVVSLGFVFNFL